MEQFDLKVQTSNGALDLSDFEPTSDLSQAETLPARWYTEPRFLELETERIFYKTWQPVGRVENVLRPGDFFTCEVVGQPIVVTRGLDDQLRAYYNVCMHRAGPVAAGQGNRKSLQCKYHGWTYGLDGKLMNAPEFEGRTRLEQGGYLPENRQSRGMGSLGIRQS